MSDFLSVLVIMLSVGLVLLIPAAYFGGKRAVFITALVLTVISCFCYVYMLALGKAFSNSNSSVIINLDIALEFLAIAFLYGFIAYGSFCLRQVACGQDGYKIKVVIWSLLLVGVPLSIYANNTYSIYKTHKKYYSTAITIAHAKDFPILIDRIKFFNSKTQNASSISARFHENYRKVREIEGLRDSHKLMHSQRYYTKMANTLVPIGFDSFELSWFSVLENRFYKDVFSIDQSKFKVGENYEKQRTINNMLFNIQPNGYVDLLKEEYSNYIHLASYSDTKSYDVSDQTLDSIFQLHSQVAPLDARRIANLHRDFDILKKGTVTKLSLEDILDFRKVYSFGITIECNQKSNETNTIKAIEVIDFYLNQYSKSAAFLQKTKTQPLPSLIRIKLINTKEKQRSVAIIFDKKSLVNQYNSFTDTKEEDVTFEIRLHLSELTKSQIWLQSKNKKTVLKDWIISE